MKRKFLLLAAIVLALPATAFADTFTFRAPPTAPNQGNGGPRQVDLDHHRAYTWKIDDVALQGKTITGARLTFTSISNWDRNPNMLFIHLLDSARQSGISSFVDASGTPVPVSQIIDNFGGTLYGSNPLVDPGTANTFLTSRSFTMTPETFVYDFSAEQLAVLSAYFLNGNDIAFGLDPDCHFWNNGIKLTIETADTIPEPTTMLLLGSGLAGLYFRRRRRIANSQQL